MPGWLTKRDPKTDTLVHSLKPGFGHSLVAAPLSQVFQVLRVTAAMWVRGHNWLLLHEEPSLLAFELQHGADTERRDYNARVLRRAVAQKRMMRTSHAGYCDLFAPVVVGDEVAAVLVTGPFALARPTSPAVLQRWRAMTGRQGDPSDPEFASYLSAALSTLVLGGAQLKSFERLVGLLTRLMAGDGRVEKLANEIEQLRIELEGVRKVERTWEAVAEMVDERSSRRWHSLQRAGDLQRYGLSRAPDAALVGFALTRAGSADAVDEAIRREGLQRAAADLARRAGEMIAGQVADQGIVVLSSAAGSEARRRRRLLDFAERVSLLARQRFGIALQFGIAGISRPGPLSQTYQAALAAAESALVRSVRVVDADGSSSETQVSLWHLRDELGRPIEQRPEALKARFDRYLEVVAARCGYRLELIEAHLQVGFDRVAEPLVASSILDAKTLGAMRASLDLAAREARTVRDLLSAYRRTMAELYDALERPVVARHERSVRRALDYIDRHLAEPLRLERVAREAGLTPNYFSRIFREREHVTFERYVVRLRMERAKQLLAGTAVEIARIAEICGFNSPQYFSHAFRHAAGISPVGYRRASARAAKTRRRA